jgi:hypothetical protein
MNLNQQYLGKRIGDIDSKGRNLDALGFSYRISYWHVPSFSPPLDIQEIA